jgi:uncharacterized sodium:solute symporter family permease YidK
MFLIDIPFKSCQGRSNRSSIVHAVSYFACHRCFAYDFHFSKLFEIFFCVHVVSMTPHAFKKFEYLREFEFIFRTQDGCFDEKNRWSKIS